MKRIIQSLSKRVYPGDIVIDHYRGFQYVAEEVRWNMATIQFSRKHPHATVAIPSAQITKSRCLTFKREVKIWWDNINNNETLKMLTTNGRKYYGS